MVAMTKDAQRMANAGAAYLVKCTKCNATFRTKSKLEAELYAKTHKARFGASHKCLIHIGKVAF